MKNPGFKSLIKLITLYLFFNAPISQASQDFTNVFSFGDSFSTAGTWTEFISKRYSFNYTQNKTGFAVGGGKTLDLTNMLDNYNTNAGAYDPNALYIVFMGPSDFADSANGDGLTRIGYIYEIAGPNNNLPNFIQYLDDVKNNLNKGILSFSNVFPETSQDISIRAIDMGNFIQNIQVGGAQYIVVLNYFNDSLRSNVITILLGNENGKYFDELWKNQFNSQVYNKIYELAPSANVIYIDNDRFITEITNNPTKYFSQNEITGTFNDNGFFDGTAHPIWAAQRLLSQYVTSVIESPTRVAIVREIPLETGMRSFQNTKRLAESLIYAQHEKAFSIDFRPSYTHSHTDSFTKKELGFKNGNGVGGELIFNYKTPVNVSLGGQITANNTKIDFVGNRGKTEIKEYSILVHGIYNFQQPLFIYTTVGVGKLDFIINRNIPLGTSANLERGKTNGKHDMATIGTGYRLALNNNLALLPYVSGNYQQVTIKPYTEKGEIHSTRMSFNIPKRMSVAGEIGAKIESKFKTKNDISVIPSFGVRYAHDFKDSLKNQIKAQVSDMPRSFLVPSYKVSKSSLYIEVDIGSEYNRVSLDLNASYKPTGRVKQWSLGLSLKGEF